MSINLLVKKLIHDSNIDQRIFLWYTNKANGIECAIAREHSLSFGEFVQSHKRRGFYARKDEGR